MSGHTEGPWGIDQNARTIGVFAGDLVVAEIDAADDCAWADARLMAASPEMLVMLCQYADDLRYPPEGDSRERRLAAVEALIAKATGK